MKVIIIIIWSIVMNMNLLFSQDISSYKSIIESSNVFSSLQLKDSDLKIEYINKINDTIFLKTKLIAKNGLTTEEYSSIIYNSEFKLHGDYQNTFKNGVSEFTDKGKMNNNKNAGIIYHYTDGKLNGSSSVLDNKDNGAKLFYDKEKISQIYNYVNDTLDGNYILFYDNASIKETGQYKKDTRIGLFLSYYKDGTLKCKGLYSGNYLTCTPDSMSNKMVFKFNGNKKVDFIRTYSLPLKTEVSEEMKHAMVKNYKYFLKIGVWDYYSNDGKVIKKIIYDKNGDIK